MNLSQNPHFEPITIVLTNALEAAVFWGILEAAAKSPEGDVRDMAIDMSNWFSSEARL